MGERCNVVLGKATWGMEALPLNLRAVCSAAFFRVGFCFNFD